MGEGSVEPEKFEDRRYFQCMFDSDRKVPEVLLERIRQHLKAHGVWTEVENWRETGATCDVQFDDQIVISVILARLFGISGYKYTLLISRQRSWGEFFASLWGTQSINPSGKILRDFRQQIDLAIKECGVERVVWSNSSTYPDFSNTEEWFELTD